MSFQYVSIGALVNGVVDIISCTLLTCGELGKGCLFYPGLPVFNAKYISRRSMSALARS